MEHILPVQEIKEGLLHDVSRLRSPEGYLNAGYPNYNTLFGRDSLIASWQLLDFDPNIAQSTLRILARYQATDKNDKKESAPGKILHEYRLSNEARAELPHWEWPYYGSVDATSLFLIILGEYVRKTDSTDLAEDLWPTAEAALRWHLANAEQNKCGFITYTRRNPHGLVHQGWKDAMDDHLRIMPYPVAIVEEQGYAYKAYRAFAELAEKLDVSETLASQAREAAGTIQKNFREYFWMNDESYPGIGMNGEGELRRSVASNQGHLLACDDFLNDEEAGLIAKRLFADDMWSIGGVYTLSTKDPDFDPFSYHLGSVWPHDNWMIYKGLRARGFHEEAQTIKQALLLAYSQLEYIPELYSVTEIEGEEHVVPTRYIEHLESNNEHEEEHLRSIHANPLQAWATGALLSMLLE